MRSDGARAVSPRVVRDDALLKGRRAIYVDTGARISTDSAAADRQCSLKLLNATTPAVVTADRAVNDCHGGGIRDARRRTKTRSPHPYCR